MLAIAEPTEKTSVARSPFSLDACHIVPCALDHAEWYGFSRVAGSQHKACDELVRFLRGIGTEKCPLIRRGLAQWQRFDSTAGTFNLGLGFKICGRTRSGKPQAFAVGRIDNLTHSVRQRTTNRYGFGSVEMRTRTGVTDRH